MNFYYRSSRTEVYGGVWRCTEVYGVVCRCVKVCGGTRGLSCHCPPALFLFDGLISSNVSWWATACQSCSAVCQLSNQSPAFLIIDPFFFKGQKSLTSLLSACLMFPVWTWMYRLVLFLVSDSKLNIWTKHWSTRPNNWDWVNKSQFQCERNGRPHSDHMRQEVCVFIHTSDIALATLWLAISPQKSVIAAPSSTQSPQVNSPQSPETENVQNKRESGETASRALQQLCSSNAGRLSTETCGSASRPGPACKYSQQSLCDSGIYSPACCFTERLSERAASLEVCKHSRKKRARTGGGAGRRVPAQKCGWIRTRAGPTVTDASDPAALLHNVRQKLTSQERQAAAWRRRHWSCLTLLCSRSLPLFTEPTSWFYICEP